MSRASTLSPGVENGAFVVGLVLGVFVKAWLIMLVLGGLHHEVSADVPAVSYLGALLVYLAASLLVGGAQAMRSADNS